MIPDHQVDQEEFQMAQLPEISTEQQQEHLIYKHMSSVVDHPWSKPARGRIGSDLLKQNKIFAGTDKSVSVLELSASKVRF